MTLAPPSLASTTTGPIGTADSIVGRIVAPVRARAASAPDHALATSLVLRILGWITLLGSLGFAGLQLLFAWQAAWSDTWTATTFDPMMLVLGAAFAAGSVLAGGTGCALLVGFGRMLELHAYGRR